MNLLRYYIYYILLHLTLAGSSLIQVGDAISVNMDSSLSYSHSSNILKAEKNELSDGTYKFTPGAVVNFGKPGTKVDLRLRAYYDVLKYQDYSDLDINLFKVFFEGSYNPSEKMKNEFSYANVEGQSGKSELSIPGAPALVETSRINSSFSTSYRFSPFMSISSGLNISELTYDTYTDQLASVESTNLPLNLIYHFSNKLSLIYGVSLTNKKIGERTAYISKIPVTLDGYETNSAYYNVGLRGTIMPKLTGRFNIGYHRLSFSTNTSDFNAIGATSALTWTVSPKLRTTLNFSRDFDASGNGSTYRSTMANISTVYSLNNDFRLSLNTTRGGKYYRSNASRQGEGTGRGEKLTNISLNLHYIPSKNYNFTVSYNFVKNDAIKDYDLNEMRFTAKFKY